MKLNHASRPRRLRHASIRRFINSSAEKTEGITAIAVSSSRKHVAVAEKGDIPVISIFDTITGKRRKMLSYTEQLGSKVFWPTARPFLLVSICCFKPYIYIYIYIYINANNNNNNNNEYI